jgi:hypothetical protein
MLVNLIWHTTSYQSVARRIKVEIYKLLGLFNNARELNLATLLHTLLCFLKILFVSLMDVEIFSLLPFNCNI